MDGNARKLVRAVVRRVHPDLFSVRPRRPVEPPGGGWGPFPRPCIRGPDVPRCAGPPSRAPGAERPSYHVKYCRVVTARPASRESPRPAPCAPAVAPFRLRAQLPVPVHPEQLRGGVIEPAFPTAGPRGVLCPRGGGPLQNTGASVFPAAPRRRARALAWCLAYVTSRAWSDTAVGSVPPL